jgi:hypothetical protein
MIRRPSPRGPAGAPLPRRGTDAAAHHRFGPGSAPIPTRISLAARGLPPVALVDPVRRRRHFASRWPRTPIVTKTENHSLPGNYITATFLAGGKPRPFLKHPPAKQMATGRHPRALSGWRVT